MSQKTLILDGFWYCLRPSFALTPPTHRGFSFSSQKRRSKRHGPPTLWTSLECPDTSQKFNRDPRLKGDKVYQTFLKDISAGNEYGRQSTRQQDYGDGNQMGAIKSPGFRRTGKVKGRGLRVVLIPDNIKKSPVGFLEAKLQQLATKSPDIMTATRILRVLIGYHKIRPNVRHYRALILNNCDPKRGSADQVRSLLAEMEPNGIPLDSGTLHAALQALAVHPDYLLIEIILQTLRDRWLSLSPAGWNFVVAGLVRQNQFELALDHIAQMEMKNILVENWVHSQLVYNLCEIEDFDEVLRLIRSRTRQGHDITLDLWYYVLDMASEALHHGTTLYVWRRTVELGYLQPPYGICRNILTTASRAGDTALAASVFKYLDDIDVPRGLEDYEKMAETHLVANNLYSAFETLCTMHKSGIELEGSSTRSILTFMIDKGTTPRAAWDMLKQLNSKKYDIPVGCANVVIELCENRAQYDKSVADEGVSFYKELYSLCSKGADVLTYNSLIRMCRWADNREAAMFIVKEMSALNVAPNDQTFENLILVCLDAGNFQSAWLYYQDFLERGGNLSEVVATQIRDSCSNSDDEFAAKLRYHPLIRGNVVRRYHANDRPKTNQAVGEISEDKPIEREHPITSGDLVRQYEGKGEQETERETKRETHRDVHEEIQHEMMHEIPQEAVQTTEQDTQHEMKRGTLQESERESKQEPQQTAKEISEDRSARRHTLPWPVRRQHMTREERIAVNKERRKRKRRYQAIERNKQEEGWMNHEAGGLMTEDEVKAVKDSPNSPNSPGSADSQEKSN